MYALLSSACKQGVVDQRHSLFEQLFVAHEVNRAREYDFRGVSKQGRRVLCEKAKRSIQEYRALARYWNNIIIILKNRVLSHKRSKSVDDFRHTSYMKEVGLLIHAWTLSSGDCLRNQWKWGFPNAHQGSSGFLQQRRGGFKDKVALMHQSRREV